MSNDVSQNVIALLETSSTIKDLAANRIREDHVPQLNGTLTEPFIWFRQRGETPSDVLNGEQGEAPDNVIFDMECSGGSQRRVKQKALGAAVRSLLNNYKGSMGDSTTKGIFITDKENDYVPFSAGGDAGILVTAFDVTVWL